MHAVSVNAWTYFLKYLSLIYCSEEVPVIAAKVAPFLLYHGKFIVYAVIFHLQDSAL